MLRGGGWGNTPPEIFFRSTYRHCDNGDLPSTEVGFRVARSISAQTTTPKDTKRPAKATARMRPLNPSAVRTFKMLEGHEAPVLGLAFSPDGRLLASASADKTIRVWASAPGRARQAR